MIKFKIGDLVLYRTYEVKIIEINNNVVIIEGIKYSESENSYPGKRSYKSNTFTKEVSLDELIKIN